MNNLEAFLSLNAPKAKDAEIEAEINEAMLSQDPELLKDQPEAEMTTSTVDRLQTLQELMKSAPRKLKRKLTGQQYSFANTLMARLKKK